MIKLIIFLVLCAVSCLILYKVTREMLKFAIRNTTSKFLDVLIDELKEMNYTDEEIKEFLTRMNEKVNKLKQ